jgi:hypothetical protein
MSLDRLNADPYDPVLDPMKTLTPYQDREFEMTNPHGKVCTYADALSSHVAISGIDT